MGNHRFRLANMLPNAWFYKLKDLRRATAPNHNPRRNKKDHPSSSSSSSSSSSTSYSSSLPPPHQSKTTLQISHQRKSYYFSRELTPPPQSPSRFPESPRKSSTQSRRSSSTTNARRKRASPRLVTASVSAGCSCRATLDSVWTKPDSTSEDYPNSPLDTSSDVESLFPELGSDHGNDDYCHPTNNSISSSTSCQCRVLQNDDIVIDINENDKQPLNTNRDGFNTVVSHLQLPPISTKKPDNFRGTNPAQLEPRSIITTRREKRSSPGVRLRTNSPRIAASWKIQGHGRKSVSSSGRTGTSLSDSFAVVKSSADPQRDFKESMVEMILENNIRASKDLEDLLACYLQLNSDEYHELIIKVFKQIWLDFADVRLKE